MREENDFSQSVKNPYTKQLKKPVTIDLGRGDRVFLGNVGGYRHSLSNSDQFILERLCTVTTQNVFTRILVSSVANVLTPHPPGG